MKYIITILLIIISVIILGCKDAKEDSSQYGDTITITDSINRKVIIKNNVTRAVVTKTYTAEMINAIGAIDKVVGVDYAIYQDQEGYNHRFTKDNLIGNSSGDVNYEKIVELKPDVYILSSNSGWENAVKKLAPFDIPVVVIDSYYTDQFQDNVKLLGIIFQRQDSADKFIKYFTSQLEYIDKQLINVPKKKLYFEYRRPGSTTVPGDYFSKMVEYAHADNVYKNASNVNIDIESVVNKNPEYIVKVSDVNVRSKYNPPTKKEMQDIKSKLITRPGWEQIDAVKNDRILLLSHYVHGGASKLVGTMYIAKFLYPEYLPDLHPEAVFREWLTEYQHLQYISGHTYPKYELKD